MSTFAVSIKRVQAIVPHENADRLELVQIDGYQSVAVKNQFKVGDLVAYLPEAAVLPAWLLRSLGLWNDVKQVGRLGGSKGTRIRAVELRGTLSQGICYELSKTAAGEWALPGPPGRSELRLVQEGEDVAEWLGVEKYEPPIPPAMAGEVLNAGLHLTLKYDIENVKAYPNALVLGEEVVMTEKLHGTFTGMAWLPPEDEIPGHGRLLVFSKGLGGDGLAFKFNDANVRNVYVRVAKDLGLAERFSQVFGDRDTPVFVLGETFGMAGGQPVQDLTYGQAKLALRVFDIAEGYRSTARFVDYDQLIALTDALKLPRVPLLYRGPFSPEALALATNGNETLSGTEAHIREGTVVRPAVERRIIGLGRVQLKSVSPAYLLRKGNPTENQ